MFITKKHLSRRLFLRGAGVAVGLPLLDCHDSRHRPHWRKRRPMPTPHMGFIYFPHGAIMDHWTPATEGIGLRDCRRSSNRSNRSRSN